MCLSAILLGNKFIFNAFIGELGRNELTVIKSSLVHYSLVVIFGIARFSEDSFNAKTLILFVVLLIFKFYELTINDRMIRSQGSLVKFEILLVLLITSNGLLSHSLFREYFIALKESLRNSNESGELCSPDYFFIAVEAAAVGMELMSLACKVFVTIVSKRTRNFMYIAFDTLFQFGVLCLRSFYVLFMIIAGYGVHMSFIYPIGYTYAEFVKAYKITTRVISTARALNKRFPLVSMSDFPNVDNTCLICREEIRVGRLMPCGHIFHDECVKPWLISQGTCPTCLKDVLRTSLTYEDALHVLRHMNASNTNVNSSNNDSNSDGNNDNCNGKSATNEMRYESFEPNNLTGIERLEEELSTTQITLNKKLDSVQSDIESLNDLIKEMLVN